MKKKIEYVGDGEEWRTERNRAGRDKLRRRRKKRNRRRKDKNKIKERQN